MGKLAAEAAIHGVDLSPRAEIALWERLQRSIDAHPSDIPTPEGRHSDYRSVLCVGEEPTGIEWLTDLIYDEVKEDDSTAEILIIDEARYLLCNMIKIVISSMQDKDAKAQKKRKYMKEKNELETSRRGLDEQLVKLATARILNQVAEENKRVATMGLERAKIELETTNNRLSEQLVKLATAQTLQQVAEIEERAATARLEKAKIELETVKLALENMKTEELIKLEQLKGMELHREREELLLGALWEDADSAKSCTCE